MRLQITVAIILMKEILLFSEGSNMMKFSNVSPQTHTLHSSLTSQPLHFEIAMRSLALPAPTPSSTIFLHSCDVQYSACFQYGIQVCQISFLLIWNLIVNLLYVIAQPCYSTEWLQCAPKWSDCHTASHNAVYQIGAVHLSQTPSDMKVTPLQQQSGMGLFISLGKCERALFSTFTP